LKGVAEDVPEIDISQLPIAEMILGAALALMMLLMFLIGKRSGRGRAQHSAPSPQSIEAASTPLRRLEQDLTFLVDFIKEFPTLITELHRQSEVRQIPTVLCNAMVRVFRAEQAVVLVRRKGTLIEPDRSTRLIVAAVASSERGLDVGTEIPIGEGQLGIVAQSQQVMDRGDFGTITDTNLLAYRGHRMPQFEVVAPMVHDAETLGVLAFSRPQRHHPREKEMLHMIAQLGAQAWYNLTAYRHVKVAADVDELTGIFNKRALKFRLSELVYEARQNLGKVSVFLFDIDHFKNYNDLNGHIAGDQALRLLAQLVRDTVRADDIFGRFGGEEFLLIMPGRTPAQAMSAAGNIRQRIAHYEFPFGENQPLGRVTVSGGVSTFPDDAQDAVEMLLAADTALYRAKQAGRNQVLRAETGINPLGASLRSVSLDDDSNR
jgi:diguanylate cyclase (GGDEF)-like protein